MSKLEELIQQYCPDGVEYKSIESITKNICSGLNPRKNFTLNGKGANCYYLTVKEMTTGKIVFSDKTDKITPDAVNIIQNRSRLETDDILLSGIGTIGKVAIVDIPVDNWNCSESVLLLKPNKDIICPKYLKYILEGNETQAYFNSHATGSTLKGIRQKDLRTHSIPVPPLPVQEEIVRILDSFTELQAELQAELQKRLQQYNYYRDNLLSFEGRTDVEWKKLGEIGKVCMCKRILKDQTSSTGDIPFFKIGTFGGSADAYISKELFEEYVKKYSYPKKGDILISAAGTIGRTVVFDGTPSYFQDSNIVWLKHDESVVLNSYLRYIYSLNPWAISTGGTIARLYNDNILNAVIPVPSLEEQQKIVDILDRFSTLTTDIIAGLPAEIEARRKQYEYYRDQLLTFKQKA